MFDALTPAHIDRVLRMAEAFVASIPYGFGTILIAALFWKFLDAWGKKPRK